MNEKENGNLNYSKAKKVIAGGTMLFKKTELYSLITGQLTEKPRIFKTDGKIFRYVFRCSTNILGYANENG